MKLIESKAEYIPQEKGLEGIYKMIELAGRTAYHSQDKITPTSAKDFVDRMIKSKHEACLEHGTVYLVYGEDRTRNLKTCSFVKKYLENPYSHVVFHRSDILRTTFAYITTNYRVLEENMWETDIATNFDLSEFHEKRYTIRFTCSRAIANELVRHRVFSFLQESTRYINYSKERHGGEITFIEPSWLKETPFDIDEKLMESFSQAEDNYLWLLHWLQPQQARDVLPNATKTELIMTGFSSDWRFLMDLRLFEKTGKVHPDMLDLMQKAQKAMQEAGIWDDIMSKPSKFDQYV